PYGPLDMAASLPYWFLLSLAFMHAAVRLALEPHRWDKTPHQDDVEPISVPDPYPDAGRAAA
ncbi:glycosyltransferase family 2 protein, partial [Brevundimonas naejangsanensis]